MLNARDRAVATVLDQLTNTALRSPRAARHGVRHDTVCGTGADERVTRSEHEFDASILLSSTNSVRLSTVSRDRPGAQSGPSAARGWRCCLTARPEFGSGEPLSTLTTRTRRSVLASPEQSRLRGRPWRRGRCTPSACRPLGALMHGLVCVGIAVLRVRSALLMSPLSRSTAPLGASTPVLLARRVMPRRNGARQHDVT